MKNFTRVWRDKGETDRLSLCRDVTSSQRSTRVTKRWRIPFFRAQSHNNSWSSSSSLGRYMTCCLSSRDGKGLGIREEQDTTSCCLIPNWSLRKPADLTVASEIIQLLSLVASSPDLRILSEMSGESERNTS